MLLKPKISCVTRRLQRFLMEFTGNGTNRLKPPVNFQDLQVIPSPDYPPGIKHGNVKSTVDVALDAIFN
jgi:hypothetical protein